MLALAAGWPEVEPHVVGGGRDVVVVEADPTGGSLAAWLDTPLSPSLSSVVTALHQGSSTGATRPTQWSLIDAMIRRSASGVRFVPAPFRTREARGAIGEAELLLFPLLAAVDHTVALVDVGRIDPLRLPPATRHADLLVLVHRQDASSAPAATVRLERLAETVEAVQRHRRHGRTRTRRARIRSRSARSSTSPHRTGLRSCSHRTRSAPPCWPAGPASRRADSHDCRSCAPAAPAASELDRLVGAHHPPEALQKGGAA